MRSLSLAVFCWAALSAASAQAQFSSFGDPEVGKGARLDQARVQRVQVGMVVTAQGMVPCKGLVGTAPVPLEWPEQQVRSMGEEFSPSVKSVNYRMVGGTVKQVVVTMPFIPAGEEVKAVSTFEIRRFSQLPPEDTSIFQLPDLKKLKPDVRVHLAPSPQIESNHPTIKALAKELTEGHESAWEKVESIYDGVRQRVTYVEGPLKGAIESLKDGTGDCEELSSLFIACCRASGVPARIVWVPGHCYPEFYLVDDEGNGHWLPCQAAGNREFGGITEFRPILQKGDNFQVPERRDRQRYVAEHLTGSGGKPKVRFLRDVVDIQ